MVIGILAHVDAGKTTLSEAMLYTTGQIRNLGRVDHQDAYLDTDSQERERGITIFSKQARIMQDDFEVTLLDTPGHVDFSAEMERTLQVLDYAILVISGTDGVQGHTRTLWRLLKHYDIPTFIFVNKMDMNGTDKASIKEQLEQELSEGCMELVGDYFEEVAMCDEALLDEYMENGILSSDSIKDAIVKRMIFPCYFGSALKLKGVLEFVDGLKEWTKEKTYPKDFSARVYKIGHDPRGGRLTFMKITGGQLPVREKIEYESQRQALEDEALITEKVDQIRKYSGEKFETCDVAKAGEVVAVTGLSATYPGQGIGAEHKNNAPVLEPVLNYQLILPEGVNPSEFMKNIRVLEEEDPQLYLVWKEELKEIHVQLMGQVQMEVLVRQIKDRFGVVVTFGPGSIVYKETIARPVEGVGHFEPLRHYAEAHLLLSPGEKGSGITVNSICSEDILDKNWQRLITTHVEEREHPGVLTGSSITDIKVTILTGRAHIKHTEGGDFRQATYRAIRQGLKSTESILLEPYYNFRLDIPMEHVGRALTDLEQRFCKVDAPEFATVGSREIATIKGCGPVSTMQDYVSEVHAYTQGLGSLMLELAGYDVCHNPEEVIEKIGYDSELDFRNPTGSVFCAHGSGYVVPWDEVADNMHLPYVYHGEEDEEELKKKAKAFSSQDAELLAGANRNESWAKSVSKMSEVELDAELADVYAREFKMNKTQLDDESRQKWVKKKSAPTVKLDKKGNPIYPKKKILEDYLIVDGYNIIFAWDELKELSKVNIDAARDKLKDELLNYQAYKGCHVVLVFDAYKVKGNSGKHEVYTGMNKKLAKEAGAKENGNVPQVDVYYTKQDEIADAFIEKMVHDLRDKYRITVATSDALEQQTVMSLGALRMSARELMQLIHSDLN